MVCLSERNWLVVIYLNCIGVSPHLSLKMIPSYGPGFKKIVLKQVRAIPENLISLHR